jgi:acyl-CoA thioesterase II
MLAPDSFATLMDLTAGGPRRWAAPGPEGSKRPSLYGGLVAAQALRAAHLDSGLDRMPHSIHAYFLTAGRFGEPLQLHVTRVRDGRSFSVRRVEASQSGGIIFTMLASFQTPEKGDDYVLTDPRVPEPGPAAIGSSTGQESGTRDPGPFEIIECESGPPRPGSSDWSSARYWARVRTPVPPDDGLSACALVAIGDLRTGYPPREAMTLGGDVSMTSLDYSIWCRGSVPAGGWLLFDLRPSGNGGARGLTQGYVFGGGEQVASFAMEMLLRPIDPLSNGQASSCPADRKAELR